MCRTPGGLFIYDLTEAAPLPLLLFGAGDPNPRGEEGKGDCGRGELVGRVGGGGGWGWVGGKRRRKSWDVKGVKCNFVPSFFFFGFGLFVFMCIYFVFFSSVNANDLPPKRGS